MNKRKLIAVLLCLCFALSFMMPGYSAAIAEEGASDNGTSATDSTTTGGDSDNTIGDSTTAPSGSDADNNGAPDNDTPTDSDNTADQPPVTPDNNDNTPSAGGTADPTDNIDKPATDTPVPPTEPQKPTTSDSAAGDNKSETGDKPAQDEQPTDDNAEPTLARAQAFIALVNALPQDTLNSFLTADETTKAAASDALCAALDTFLGELEKVDVGVAFESTSQSDAYLYAKSVTADIAKLQALLADYAPADELADSYTAAVERFNAWNDTLSAFMPVEPEENEFDAERFYSELMAMSNEDIAQAIAKLTPQQVIDLFAVMNEEDAKRVYDLMSEEQIAEVEKYYAELHPQEDEEEEEEFEPIVNFTDVAPFLKPVKSTLKYKPLRANSLKAARGEDNPNIQSSKSVTPNSDGKSYTIRLESFVTGKTTTTTVTEDIPTDIVLVLDQSGSMTDPYSGQSYRWDSVYNLDKNKTYYAGESHTKVTWCNDCNAWTNGCSDFLWWHTDGTKYTPKTSADDTTAGHVQFYERVNIPAQNRLQALQDAVNEFANAVAEKAKGPDGQYGTTDDINHRIAVIGYAGPAYSWDDENNNTELFIGKNQYKYGREADAQYKNAFQDMSTEVGKNNVLASSAALSANGATYTDNGMEMANKVFEKDPLNDGKKRNKVVILFSDGFPGNNSTDFNSTRANRAINQAKISKDTYKATVYTVGIFSGADATSAGSNSNRSSVTQKANWFMQQVSSNNGTPQTPSYYLTPSTADSLSDIFKQISEQVQTGGSSIALGTETKVVDKMSDYFTLPDGASSSYVTVSTAEFDGFDSNNNPKWKNKTPVGLTAEVDTVNNTVTVSGFDFAENYVGIDDINGTQTPHGKKLIIEFTVEPKDGFLGGNNVPTNDGEHSGIYGVKDGEETLLENFITPKANVPITDDIQITVGDKNIYLNGSLTAEQLKEGLTATAAGNDLTSAIGWQDDFVDITFADSTGTFENMLDDTTYTAKVTIAPKPEYDGTGAEGEAATAVSKESDAAKINVFKPTFTFKDSEVYYGETTPADFDSNLVSVSTAWKHGETLDSTVTMIGTAPTEFAFTYDKANTLVDKPVDIPVSVTEVTLDGVSVKEHVSYAHQDCAGAAAGEGLEAGQHFWLHVKTCTLTIKKEGCADIDYTGTTEYDGTVSSEKADMQSFIFTVERVSNNDDVADGITKKFTVTVQGNGSVTIGNLPTGKYIVTEDKNWSWRYKLSNVSDYKNAVYVKSYFLDENDNKTETIYNERISDKWLNGGAFSINQFN